MVMANHNVEIFDNVLSDNGTTNIMVVGYRFDQKDPNYNPYPRDVTIWDNQHGRAGWAPEIDGGKEIAAAVGGTFPSIFWDGTGGVDKAPKVYDEVLALSLGLDDIKAPPADAKPGPLPKPGEKPARLPKIVLPAAMEAAVD